MASCGNRSNLHYLDIQYLAGHFCLNNFIKGLIYCDEAVTTTLIRHTIVWKMVVSEPSLFALFASMLARC